MHVGRLDREAAAPRHRVARVERQVEQRVADLRRVGAGEPEIGRMRRLDADRLAECPAQHLHVVPQQCTQIDALGPQRLIARDREEATRQQRSAQRTVQDLTRQVGMLGFMLHRVRQDLGAADDHAQQIVEVVRDASGELPKCLHLLRPAQHFLGTQALRDLAPQLLERLLQPGEGLSRFRLGALALADLVPQMLIEAGKLAHARLGDSPPFH